MYNAVCANEMTVGRRQCTNLEPFVHSCNMKKEVSIEDLLQIKLTKYLISAQYFKTSVAHFCLLQATLLSAHIIK